MPKVTQNTDFQSHQLCVRVYGVTVGVRAAEPAVLEALQRLLPPVHEAGDPADAVATLTAPATADLAVAVGELDADVRRIIATHAPAHVFVHAGVVARDGAAIVLPAPTHAGKSELVAALVERGAVYYSDEYAVLDADGAVHPYARPVSLRPRPGRPAREATAAELGGPTGDAPVPIGLIAATAFADGATFAPAERSPADGALLLLGQAGQARAEPDRVLGVLQRAARGARVLEGPRGEAGPAADALLAALDGSGG